MLDLTMELSLSELIKEDSLVFESEVLDLVYSIMLFSNHIRYEFLSCSVIFSVVIELIILNSHPEVGEVYISI
jgi:hypothetical protein